MMFRQKNKRTKKICFILSHLDNDENNVQQISGGKRPLNMYHRHNNTFFTNNITLNEATCLAIVESYRSVHINATDIHLIFDKVINQQNTFTATYVYGLV